MKKLLYIACFIGMLLSLPSCDRFYDSRNNETANNGSTESNKTTADSTSTTKDSSQATKEQDHKIDSVVAALSDSLKALNVEIENVKQSLDSLDNRQEVLQKEKIGLLDLFKWFAALALAMVLIVWLLLKKIVAKERGKQTKEQKAASKEPKLNNRTKVTELELAVMELRKKVGTLEKTLKDKNEKEVKFGQQPYASSPTPIPAPAPLPTTKIPQRDVESNVFYMKRPLAEKEFDLSLKSASPNEETLYRFEVNSRNRKVACFYFDCKLPARIRWAFSNKDNTLDPVCNVGGDASNGTYECTTPGEAKFEGGKWIVTRKAVVIFS